MRAYHVVGTGENVDAVEQIEPVYRHILVDGHVVRVPLEELHYAAVRYARDGHVVRVPSWDRTADLMAFERKAKTRRRSSPSFSST